MSLAAICRRAFQSISLALSGALWCGLAGVARGTFRLTTVGRKSGKKREAILGYIEDGPNLVTVAMNGWAAPEPAWWLNLQANPEATVLLTDGLRAVRGRAATAEERERLWDRWRAIDDKTDAYKSLRPSETALVVLEPRAVDPPPIRTEL